MRKRFTSLLVRAVGMTTVTVTVMALAVSVSAALVSIARPDYQNLSGAGAVNSKNPAVTVFQGLIKPPATAPFDGAEHLTEAAFGQPFAPWISPSSTTPTGTYAADVVATVRNFLYPRPGALRPEVLSSSAAFRYKWLLFSPNPGESDVTSHFQSMSNWFGLSERALVASQILVLRDALAVSPLDTGLRHLLLDCYYDLAVAEMQFTKQQLSTLAAKHLGLTVTSPFVIDEEIAIYTNVIAMEAGVLAKYGELLSTTVEGVDPADFDGRERPGKPMGLYTFLHEQPYRNATASEYATDTQAAVLIPDYDAETHTAVVRQPTNLVLYRGYKDYVILLQVMGQYIQHQAELARLRGMRQAPNDLTLARNAISQIQSATATDYCLLRGLVRNNFPPGDASGVNAAVNGVESALADLSGVRGFLNGTVNVLGLDPNFLLLVQGANLPGGFNNESFDVLYGLLRGPNQPLGDALEKLVFATGEYQNFRASVDRVVAELGEVDGTFTERFYEITGYEVDEIPGFNGVAKPFSGSELDLVQQSIASLRSRNLTLSNLTSELQNDLAVSQAAVTLADGLNSAVDKALQSYTNTTSELYKDMEISAGVAAAAQVGYDVASDIASLDALETIFGKPGIIGAAGVLNMTAQSTAAALQVNRERQIDFAARSFESVQQQQDNALTANSALQNLGALKREQRANQLEVTDNQLALSQALSQKKALLDEVERITAARESDSQAVRKNYYADPIHYVRSENALILADAAFRNAQRWIFYTQRALEYKWQQAFSRTENSAQGIRSFDSGTVFKLRNARELDDLLTQLKGWNDDRAIQDRPNAHTSFISLRHDVLTPNPYALNSTPALQADTGLRVDLVTGETVSQLELFRRLLARKRDASGHIVIPINTVSLAGLHGNFFVPPTYTANSVFPGEWRDKIVYLKVNIIADDGNTSAPATIAGGLTYGGQMFFRTRIPPCPNRSVYAELDDVKDIPGEFFTAPFRFFFSQNYDNAFTSRDRQTASIGMAYTGSTAISPTGEEILGSTFQINDFNQRSVATTRLELTLFSGSLNLARIRDIEIIVRHHSSGRTAPVCP